MQKGTCDTAPLHPLKMCLVGKAIRDHVCGLATAVNVQDSVSWWYILFCWVHRAFGGRVWGRQPYATVLYCRTLGLISQRWASQSHYYTLGGLGNKSLYCCDSDSTARGENRDKVSGTKCLAQEICALSNENAYERVLKKHNERSMHWWQNLKW